MQLVEDEWVVVISANAVDLQETVLYELNMSALGDHIRFRKLEALVQHQFYWSSLSADMFKSCSECDFYQ